MQYDITDIKWDTDGVSRKKLGLPSSLTLDIEDGDDVADTISEMLSDRYGYCHFGFTFVPHKERKDAPAGEQNITVTLTASQQRLILDHIFEDLEKSRRALDNLDAPDRPIMQAHIDSLNELVKILSA